MNIDLSFYSAARVFPKENQGIRFYLIGAGGTGSFAAPIIGRLAVELRERGKSVQITIIDPDRVEAGNIPRSNFCAAEIDRFKAQTLAERLSCAWGLEIGYRLEKFDYEKHLKHEERDYRDLRIIVGCVDNHRARRDIHEALKKSGTSGFEAPNIWWIDGGNGQTSGQVVIGSATGRIEPEKCFSAPNICRILPAPSIIHPELIEIPKTPLSREPERQISCAERVRLGEQSLNINQRVAVEIGQMLTEFLLTGSLRRFATYFDLESGTGRSSYCTVEQIGEALKRAENFHAARSSKKTGA